MIPLNSRSKVFVSSGWGWGGDIIPRPPNGFCVRTAGAVTATEAARGSITCNNFPINWTSAWEFVITHQGPVSGIVEHRLFSFISLNWKAEPLVSCETVVNLIGSTRTKKGLRVKAKLDKKQYATGKKISDDEMDQLNIKYDKVNPQWNYTIYPRTKKKKTEK
jgi:hypothetical protein